MEKLQAYNAELQGQLDKLRDSSLDQETRAATATDQLQAETAALFVELKELRSGAHPATMYCGELNMSCAA